MTGIANGLTLPNSLTNGQTTDAPLVMANYNTLLAALNRAPSSGKSPAKLARNARRTGSNFGGQTPP